jgi:hypothetical protein
VQVLYRRGPDEIPARRIELEGAIEEGIEFVYNTQPVAVEPKGDGLALKCVRTELGDPEEDGRRRPVNVEGSELDVDCGLVIASVGQKGVCDELEGLGMMRSDLVDTDFDSMRTTDPQVFAAGDGAFGGSTIVMAMHHGQKAAYYVRHYLEGNDEPLPYRTPYRTRRVPVAQDAMWERHALQHPEFLGLGKEPVTFPEIEVTYDPETAHKEAARCYRCDAETGTPDYSVQHREDLFSMARIDTGELDKQEAMLRRRLVPRDNPFPEARPAQLEDLVFLPANLSRLVIDPYREACRVSYDLGGQLEVAHPFLVTGFDGAPREVREAIARGIAASRAVYVGAEPLSSEAAVPWLQLLADGDRAADAAGVLRVVADAGDPRVPEPLSDTQLTGLVVSHLAHVEAAVDASLDQGGQVLLVNGMGTSWPANEWGELRGAPDLRLLRDAVRVLRQRRREGEIDLIHFGGVRSGTDAAKLIGLGAVAMVLGVSAGLAAGGRIGDGGLVFDADLGAEERSEALANVIQASTSEASMMARCCGKTVLYNVEPEDLRALTLATSEATGIPLAGKRG